MEIDKENKSDNKNKNQNKTTNRKIQKKWTAAEVNRLIELFEQRPDLWNPSRENYSNR